MVDYQQKNQLFGNSLLTCVYITFILVSIEYKMIWNVKYKLLAKHFKDIYNAKHLNNNKSI